MRRLLFPLSSSSVPGCAAPKTPATVPEEKTPALTTKVRLRFRKDGDLRFISHHDLMRLFERLLRRADLPIKHSEGFHPKPRMAFPSALSLGIVGHEEAIEFDFAGSLEAEAVRASLQKLAPQGLTLWRAKTLSQRSAGQPVLAEYLLPLSAQQRDGLAPKLDALLAAPELPIERAKQRDLGRPSEADVGEERLDAPFTAAPGRRPPPLEVKRLDLRPYLKSLRLTPAGLEMQLHVTPKGTARPEEVLRLLGLERLLAEGDSVLERTRLHLADETETQAAPAAAPAETERTRLALAPFQEELIHA